MPARIGLGQVEGVDEFAHASPRRNGRQTNWQAVGGGCRQERPKRSCTPREVELVYSNIWNRWTPDLCRPAAVVIPDSRATGQLRSLALDESAGVVPRHQAAAATELGVRVGSTAFESHTTAPTRSQLSVLSPKPEVFGACRSASRGSELPDIIHTRFCQREEAPASFRVGAHRHRPKFVRLRSRSVAG